MPIYEYRCAKCGKVFEALQRFSDAPLKIHEDCGGEVEKLISQSAFQLKGSGWYQTDYAKGSKAQAPKGEAKADNGSGDSKPAETKSEAKTESKTETKAESKPAATATKTD
jgi:putative FmdB family regulatory protein